MDRRLLTYLIGIAIVILAAVLWFSAGSDCGDGVCDSGEECCLDCGCALGEECMDTGQCEPAVCGDGVCSSDDCCEDCGCSENMKCDSETHLCVAVLARCGNGRCEEGESTGNCCKDCGCSPGYTCNMVSGECVKRGNTNICGDGVCDFGEFVHNCCQDCQFCEEGNYCDEVKQDCVPLAVSITPEHAISLFRVFLIDQKLPLDWVSSQVFTTEPAVYEGKPVLKVCNTLPEDHDGFADLACASVTDQGRVVGYVRFM